MAAEFVLPCSGRDSQIGLLQGEDFPCPCPGKRDMAQDDRDSAHATAFEPRTKGDFVRGAAPRRFRLAYGEYTVLRCPNFVNQTSVLTTS